MNNVYSRKRYGRCCVVPYCSMRSGTNDISQIRAFRFPQDEIRRKLWILAIRRADWAPQPSSTVCSLHFIEGKPSLDPRHPDWVPNIFFFDTPSKEQSEGKFSEWLGKKRQLASNQESAAARIAAMGESILIESEDKDAGPSQNLRVGKKRLIDDGSSSSVEKQRQSKNSTPDLPDAAEGESSSSVKKEESAAVSSSQTDPTTSVAEASAPTDAEEPPPKVAKIAIPKIDPPHALIIDGLRRRKTTKPFTPSAWLEAGKTTNPRYADYEFEGKRLVNMGYFIRNLRMLNDHDGRMCNFSHMRVCKEVYDGWNVGIMFTCNVCPSTKIIWMEDPSIEEEPKSPIIFKPKDVIKPNFAVLQPIQTSSFLRAPTATLCMARKPMVQAKLPVPPPVPQILKRVRQPYRSKRKTPTPPPDEVTPAGHLLQQQASSQVTMQTGEVSKYPKTLLIRPNTTLRYGPPQTPFSGQLLVRPVIGQQVPTVAQSQRSVINQSLLHQSSPVGQSKVPLVGVTSIKQELILPDDGTNPSLINSLSEPARVEMTFCVDQDENTAESGSVSSVTCTAMDVAKDITATPDAFAHTQSSIQSSSGQLSSHTAMDVDRTHGVTPTVALPVNLNLVKKEADDET